MCEIAGDEEIERILQQEKVLQSIKHTVECLNDPSLIGCVCANPGNWLIEEISPKTGDRANRNESKLWPYVTSMI